jgi:hypothetical protein
MGSQVGSVEKDFVHIAPAPILAGLERLDQGVLGLVEVFRGVFVFRRIATADVPAYQAFPKMDPGIAHLQAFLAALAARFNLPDLSQVGTGWG